MAQQVGLVKGLNQLDQVVRMATGKGLAANLRWVVHQIRGQPVGVPQAPDRRPALQPPTRREPMRAPLNNHPKRVTRPAPRAPRRERERPDRDAQAIVSALRGLGFRRAEAEQAIAQAQLPPGASLEEKVRATLQGMNRG